MAPHEGDWLCLSAAPIPVLDVLAWTGAPDCGAVVSFFGIVRDHAEGREGVVSLEYEAYTRYAEPRLAVVAAAARSRWAALRRVALVHRTGVLGVGETAVMVAVATPHREEAFSAARFCIDQVKATVPIWKFETWADGSAWAVPCELDQVSPAP